MYSKFDIFINCDATKVLWQCGTVPSANAPFHATTIFTLAYLLPLSLAHVPQQKTPFKLVILYKKSIADAHPSFLLEEAILYILTPWTLLIRLGTHLPTGRSSSGPRPVPEVWRGSTWRNLSGQTIRTWVSHTTQQWRQTRRNNQKNRPRKLPLYRPWCCLGSGYLGQRARSEVAATEMRVGSHENH